MQVIVHKLDWYTRIVLTLIAATLVLIVLKPVFSPRQATATAQRQIIDVNLNIDKVGGEKILTWWEKERAEKGIPLYIEGMIKTEQSE